MKIMKKLDSLMYFNNKLKYNTILNITIEDVSFLLQK